MENPKELRCVGEKLFIGGDLSGIQKFIYNISSKKAAVSLRGRSYFLAKYTEKICEEIMKVTSGAEKIYCSGGKFYIIADNSEEARNNIDEYRDTVNKEIWNDHKGQLGFNLSYVAFSKNPNGTVSVLGKKESKIGGLWKILADEFTKLKAQKFKQLLLNNYDEFFEVSNTGGDTKVCAITGIESDNCVKLDVHDDEDSNNNGTHYVLPSVKEQIEIGEVLRKKESFKTFEEYADHSYLGVLRMDVDGLGKRFIKGFDSFDEYNNFSKHLLNFFDSNLRDIQNRNQYRDKISIIYAGGDDIFAVGHWNSIIEFAYDINTEFTAYVKDSSTTISGGISINGPKFPIAKAAELSGEAEDMAKAFSRVEDGVKVSKNAICLFGQPISWNKEFEYVKSYKQQFVDLITDFGMSRSIIHKVMTYALMVQSNEKRREENKAEDFSYLWHSSYYFTRFMEKYKKNNVAVYSFVKDLRDVQLARNPRNYTLMSVAARWAEIELRNTNK